MKKILLLILCVFAFSVAHAENDKAFFWRVTSGQGASERATVYLMGSIHFADKSFYPLRKEIEIAFDKSDSLVVELDINEIDPQTYNHLLIKQGVYKNGRTIKEEISEETWLQLHQRLQQLNIPYDSVKNYKPGILVLTLSATQVMQMGFDPALGIDAYFLAKTKSTANSTASSKKIIELETLTQQINVFLEMPDAELLLKESLYSLHDAESQMTEMVRYWKDGNDKKMNKLLFEDAVNDYPAFAKIYDRLFYGRNNRMTLKIEEMLKQPSGSYFVVVGSGHLLGEKGIVNVLRKNGYAVTRL